MARLAQMLTGTLCFLAISGLTFGAVPVPEGFNVDLLTPSQRAFLVPIEILNYKFTPALVNQDTQEFKDLHNAVRSLFKGVYQCSDCSTKDFYGGVGALAFGPSGAVIANAVVVFDTPNINQVVAWALFQRHAQSAAGILKLNMPYTNRSNVMELAAKKKV